MKQKQFEEHFKTLELSKTKDSWGNEIYAHSHVQAIWDGWVAALTPVDVDAIHQDGFDEGFESGKLEATEFDRDLRRAVFGFLEKRGQIENGEEYTAQDIMDCLVAYEHYLINTNKAPKPVDVEGLNEKTLGLKYGDNKEGHSYAAGFRFCLVEVKEHLAARGCFGVPEGYALVPIDYYTKQKY